MAMCRQDRFLNTRHMLHQIFDFRTVFRGQAIAGCIRNIHYSSPCLNNGFNHTGQILIIRTAGILRIKLYIIHKATGIFHCCYRTLDNLFTVRIKFILDMRIRCTDSCMDTFTLGKFQSIHRHINILLHRTCQSTNRGPCHRFRNFDYWIKITRTGNGKPRFNHIYTQYFQRLRYLNFFYCIQLASRNLFTIPKRGVENK